MQVRKKENYIQSIQDQICQGMTNPREILSQLLLIFLDENEKIQKHPSSLWNNEECRRATTLAKKLYELVNPKSDLAYSSDDHLPAVIWRLNQECENLKYPDLIDLLSAHFSIYSMYNRMFIEPLDQILEPNNVLQDCQSKYEKILIERILNDVTSKNMTDRKLAFDLIVKFRQLLPEGKLAILIDESIKNLTSQDEYLRISAGWALVSFKSIIPLLENKQALVVSTIQGAIDQSYLIADRNQIHAITANFQEFFSVQEQRKMVEDLIEKLKSKENVDKRVICGALEKLIDFVQPDQVVIIANELVQLICKGEYQVAEEAHKALCQFRLKLSKDGWLEAINQLLLTIEQPSVSRWACKFIYENREFLPDEIQKRTVNVFYNSTHNSEVDRLGVMLSFFNLLTKDQPENVLNIFRRILTGDGYYHLGILYQLTPLLLNINISEALEDFCDVFAKRLLDEDPAVGLSICGMIKQLKSILPAEKIDIIVLSLEKILQSIDKDINLVLSACATAIELMAIYPDIHSEHFTLMQLISNALTKHAGRITTDICQTLKGCKENLPEKLFNDLADTLIKAFSSNYINIKEGAYKIACMLLDILPVKKRIEIINQLAINAVDLRSNITDRVFRAVIANLEIMQAAEKIVFLHLAAKNLTKLEADNSIVTIEFFMQLLNDYQRSLNVEMLNSKRLHKKFGLPLDCYKRISHYTLS